MQESSAKLQLPKLYEEFMELSEAINLGNKVLAKDAVGDMMVVLTLIASFIETNLTTCYATAYLEIKKRTGKMVNGIFVKD